MNNQLRLYVVEPNNSGGLVHYTYQLCTALAAEGIDVTLITATDYELADLPHNFRVVKLLRLWEHFDPESMQARPLSSLERTWRKIRWTVRRAWRGARLIRAWIQATLYILKNKPDIVQFTRIQFPFEAFFIGQLGKRGLILTQICHEFESRENSSRLENLLIGDTDHIYEHFSAMFFHAQENLNRFLSLYPSVDKNKTYVIPHGNSSWLEKLDIAPNQLQEMMKRYDLTGGENVVLFFGLLSPSKGIEDLVEAFALVSETCDAKLVIAGYPTKYFDLKGLIVRIEALDLSSKVILDTRYIPLNEISSLMSLATVVVYPYHSSTQSGALQVAYTFGRPVITTMVGGLPEAVEEGKSGYLVPVNSPRAPAEKIITLINDPIRAAEMGEYARHLSNSRFSWQTIAKQIIQVYVNLLQ